MSKGKTNVTIHISRLIEKVEIKVDPSLAKEEQERLGKICLDKIREEKEKFLQAISILSESIS